jgi:CRP/FNR family transcriptional regulator
VKCGATLDLDQIWLRPNALIFDFMMRRRIACADCAVRDRALCCALSPLNLEELNRRSHRRRYPAGRLITGGEPAEAYFAIVLSGVIKLTKSLSDGRHQIVGLLFPSDFLGRPFKSVSRCAAETATDVELCCFSRKEFERLVHEEAELGQLLLERTLDDIDAGQDWMLLLGRKNARERVAALILLLQQRMAMPESQAGAEPRSPRFVLPLSRSDMADYLGLRIETVSRQLKLLRSAGVVDIHGRTITVLDVEALKRAAEDDSG